MGWIAVTGAAGGMGRAVCERVAADGGRPIGVDLRGADVAADLSTDAGRTDCIDAVLERCGGALDGAVLCAGLPPTRPSDAVMRVNYFSTIRLLDALLPALRAGTGASAVAIASNTVSIAATADPALLALIEDGDEDAAARAAADVPGHVAYGTSKLGVVRAVRRRVQPWADAGVRLNAVAPGPVATRFLEEVDGDDVYGPASRAMPVPLGRWGSPGDVASAVCFLLSREASWIHGAVLFVDGGTDALLRPDAF